MRLAAFSAAAWLVRQDLDGRPAEDGMPRDAFRRLVTDLKRRGAFRGRLPVPLSDFVPGLEMELRLRAVPFGRGELETFTADVWRLAEDDPDVIRWSEAFLVARQAREPHNDR
jgi:hypothetical protein